MPPEIIALVEKPYLLIAVLLIGGLIGLAVERFSFKMRQRAWRENNHWRWKKKQPDAADQLRIVMGASFSIQPLLNKSEVRVFKELDRIVIGCNPDWQVMAQVSVGEILRCKDAEAFGCINSKRIDLLLVDGDCLPGTPSSIRAVDTIKARPPRAMQSRKRRCGARASVIMRWSQAIRLRPTSGDWSRSSSTGQRQFIRR